MTARRHWRRELALGATLVAIGAFLIPPAVYLVGQQVFGEYAPDSNAADLMRAIWSGLAHGSPLAWILVLSPYAVIQLLRLGWHMLRRAPASA